MFAALFSNPGSDFSPLHFHLVRPINIVLPGNVVTQRGQCLLGLCRPLEIVGTCAAYSDSHPRNCLCPKSAFRWRWQFTRLLPLSEFHGVAGRDGSDRIVSSKS